MKACLKANTLTDYLGAIVPVNGEARIRPTDDGGWHVRTVDNAHVCMADVTLDAAAFSAHRPTDRDDGLPVDVGKLADVMGLSNGDERTELHAGDGSLTVLFGNITRRLGLLNSNGMVDPSIPDLDHDATVEIELRHFRRALRATDAIADHTRFKATEQGVVASAAGNTDDVTYKMESSSVKHHDVAALADAMFSNGYLFNIAKACPAKTVRLSWSDNHPVRIEWDSNDVSAMYLVAPRIESQ